MHLFAFVLQIIHVFQSTSMWLIDAMSVINLIKVAAHNRDLISFIFDFISCYWLVLQNWGSTITTWGNCFVAFAFRCQRRKPCYLPLRRRLIQRGGNYRLHCFFKLRLFLCHNLRLLQIINTRHYLRKSQITCSD